jgi:asparagine synthase (glutamine-hydrolysing)
MQAQSSRPVKTFSIGNREDQYDEAPFAKRVAAHLGTDHTELYVTEKDVLDVVPMLPAMYDEPFADSSQIPTFLVSRLARKSVTVSLSGDGGDELFGGYNRYLFTKRIWNAVRMFPPPLRRAAAALLQTLPPGRINSMFRPVRSVLPQRLRMSTPGDKLHKFADLLHAGKPEDIYLRALSQWDEPGRVALNAHEPHTVIKRIADSNWLPRIEEAMMLSDLVNYLPDDILTKVDRASMAVSLEARVPLLDHRVVEFAWKLPMRFKIRQGKSKWLLRQVLYRHVPAELIERPKLGFGVPIDRWLRGALRPWAEDLLSTGKLAEHGLLDVETIRIKWQEHLSGTRNWQYLLWDVLVFQDWFFRNKFVREAAEPSRNAGLSMAKAISSSPRD